MRRDVRAWRRGAARRRRRSGAITVVAVLAAVTATTRLDVTAGGGGGQALRAVLPDADLLHRGSPVRRDGQTVGRVVEVRAGRGPEGRVRAELALDVTPAAARLPRGSAVAVRAQGPAGTRWLELLPGRSREPRDAGAPLRVRGSAASATDLDDVLDALDARTRRALQTSLAALGSAAAHGADDLQRLADVAPGATAGTATVARAVDGLAEAVPATRQLAEAVADAPLDDAARDVATVTGTVAATAGPLDASLARAPHTLTDLERTATTVAASAAHAARLAGTATAAAPELLPLARALDDATAAAASIDEDLPSLLRTVTPLVTDAGRTLAAGEVSGTAAGIEATLAGAQATSRRLAAQQQECRALSTLLHRLVSATSDGDADGRWVRFVPVLKLDEVLQAAAPSAELHADPYPASDTRTGCRAGSPTWRPGRRITRRR